MRKYTYTKKYFKHYGSGKINYQEYKNNPTFNKVAAEIIFLGFKGKILDIGCAKGYFLEICRKNGFQVFGVDISDYIVKAAKSYLGSKDLYKADLSNDKLPFPNNYFDVVTMIDSLEHIENPQHALREAHRLLKKGGLLCIRLPDFIKCIKEETHVNFYTPLSLKVILQKHRFKLVKMGQEGGILQIPFGLARLLLRGNTLFNYVPFKASYISCYSVKT